MRRTEKIPLGRTQLKGVNILEVAKGLQEEEADAGWACLHWPKNMADGVRRRSSA